MQTNLLNNYILITQPYGKCKESYTSVRRRAHRILFIIGRRIPKMPHVEGDDDGVGYGVFGKSSRGNGVYGNSNSGNGVYGKSSGNGVYGVTQGTGTGLYGESKGYSGNGVFGKSPGGNGVYGLSGNGTGLYGESGMYYAAFLNGKVKITGHLEKAGGSFKIDHPLDPANKYLCHSFVES